MKLQCCGKTYTQSREYLDHVREIYESIQYEMFHAAMQEIRRLQDDGFIDNAHANKLMRRQNNFTLNELQNKF